MVKRGDFRIFVSFGLKKLSRPFTLLTLHINIKRYFFTEARNIANPKFVLRTSYLHLRKI